MPIDSIANFISEMNLIILGSELFGVLFEYSARRSAFCLRFAVFEVAEGHRQGMAIVWLVGFSLAIVAVQFLIALWLLGFYGARQFAALGTISGSIIGDVAKYSKTTVEYSAIVIK